PSGTGRRRRTASPPSRAWPAIVWSTPAASWRSRADVLPDATLVGHNARVVMTPNVHVVSHGPHCLDGVASAVAVARYYAGQATVAVRFAGNNEIDSVLRGLGLESARDAALWITD